MSVWIVGVPAWTSVILLLVFIGLVPYKQNSCGAPDQQICSCERSMSNPIINEDSNTWSCVLYIFLGCLSSVMNTRYKKEVSLADLIAFPTLLATLGPCSMFLHAFTTPWGAHMDSISIQLLLVYMLGFSVARVLWWPNNWALRSLVGLMLLAILLPCEFLAPPFTVEGLFIALGSITYLLECARLRMAWSYKTGCSGLSLGWVFAGSACMAGAITLKYVGALPNHCDPNSPFQYHAGWHVLSSFSLFSFSRFYVETAKVQQHRTFCGKTAPTHRLMEREPDITAAHPSENAPLFPSGDTREAPWQRRS